MDLAEARVQKWRLPRFPSVVATLSREPVVFALVVIAATVTRFYAIGMDSAWLDEAITYHRSRGTLSEIVEDSALHHHNPAYFLLMHWWLELGDDEVMLRAPSAFFGALTVAVGYTLGRVVGGRWVAAGTAVALLLNPRLVAYAQEARMYALYAFGASVSMTGLFWIIRNPAAGLHPLLRVWSRERPPVGWKAAVAWSSCTIGWVIALYCHATAALFILSCWVVALVRVLMIPTERPRFVASFLVANALAFLAYLPWVFRLMLQVGAFKDTFWAKFPTLDRVTIEVGLSLLYGTSAFRWALVLLLAIFGSYTLRRNPVLVISLWLFAVLGPGLTLLASLWKPMFLHRQFLWAAVPLGVLVGAGLVGFAAKPVRVVALALAILAGGRVLAIDYYEPYNKERWRAAVTFLRPLARNGETIVLAGHEVKRVLEYYFTRKTSRVRRFRYVTRGDFATAFVPNVGDTIWLLGRGGGRSRVDAEFAHAGWERIESVHFGRGVWATRYRATSNDSSERHRQRASGQ
jgi:mannosyltransferase